MKTYRLSVLSLALISSYVNAAESVDGDLLRIDIGYNFQSTVFDDGDDELVVSESGFAGTGTFQSKQGFYAKLGLARMTTKEIRYNNDIYKVDESYTVRGFGAGFRVPRAAGEGLFWGSGYENTKENQDGANHVNTFKLFWEKEHAKRYGNISVAYNSSKYFNTISVSGKHIWFQQNNLGIGVAWNIGSGRTDTGYDPEAAIGHSTIGALIMYRPSL